MLSSKAAACPNCGAPLSTSSGRTSQGHQAPVRVVRAGRSWEAVGALLVIAAIAGAAFGWLVLILGLVVSIIGRFQ
jgi:hypothetical protein